VLEQGVPLLIGNRMDLADRFSFLMGTMESGLIAPMKVKDRILGILVVLCLEKSPLTSENLSLITALADLAAVALENAKLFEYERNIAETLQRSFLPTSLPHIDGYEIAARYRPAMAEAEIGGDFYDVFTSNSEDTAIVIADVSGKGLNAAIQTAMGKYMIRAYSSDNARPGTVLARFNRIYHRYAPQGQFITALYGVLNPKDNVFIFANAGHNPPMLFSSAAGKITHPQAGGICLGVTEDARFAHKKIALEPGDVLLTYTDGATDVKRDGERLDTAGLQELFLSSAHGSADEIVNSIFDGIFAFGNGRLTDDVALVVLKRSATQSL
jgi:phosphoserine phosphatase RsbU/P